jgi:hypothetical protein
VPGARVHDYHCGWRRVPIRHWRWGAGNLYIADGNHNVIREVALNGIVSTIAGQPINFAGETTTRNPAIPATGDRPLYFVDRAADENGTNDRIRMLTPSAP